MIPHYFALDDSEKHDFIKSQGAGTLVTSRKDGTIDATLLPIIISDDQLLLHMARFNEHWRNIDSPQPAAMIFTGAHDFISSRAYDVPDGSAVASTWDYTQVTIHGTVTVHDDPDWVRQAVVELTKTWDPEHAAMMTDDYLGRATKAIVGLSMTIDRIDGKAKLSQNKLPSERARISEGLRERDTERSRALADDVDAAPSKARRVPFIGGLKARG
ncbi:FMN-binding negative transcriptional regulator [Flaviflexus huanghaiensis]|uniref:FMN-binding negative transcriptional regulator n=1 Tax=Flaviflexus huanghaiensis TaxID=1111473 RepID=UPI0015FD5F2C|nr:FMN-binding negative transcriptional regulator [Flaviflexus huanghaiensis]